MKLKSLTLGGFKGIKNTAEIPLAPITLLFGANSTGKSSILHGLLYLYEILINRDPDPEFSTLTGNKVWLGGFKNLVFGKSLSNTITIGATLDFTDSSELWDDYLSEAEQYLLDSSIQCEPEATADIWSFQLEIAWSNIEKRAFIRRYECFGDGERFCQFDHTSGNAGSEISYYKPLSSWELPEEVGVLQALIDNWPYVGLEKLKDALPDIHQRLDFEKSTLDWEALVKESPLVHQLSDDRDPKLSSQEEELLQRHIQLAVRTYAEGSLSQAALAPLKILSQNLGYLLHIGPLRVIPDHSFVPEKEQSAARWYDGSGAWDLFVHGGNGIRNSINPWFMVPERFDTPYSFFLTDPVEQTGAQSIYVENRDTNVNHQPNELGVGVSQVFPFVAAAQMLEQGIVSCEQPELHIHPRWQLVLADLMLHRVNKSPEVSKPRMFLVETHSEHLMLRLLRRRRETAEGEQGLPDLLCNHDDIQIIFCEQENGETRLMPITTTDEGEFDAPWPKGFFTERRGELF